MLSERLKKITAILLIMTLVFSLSACTGAMDEKETSESKQASAATEEKQNKDKTEKKANNDMDEKDDDDDTDDKQDAEKDNSDKEDSNKTANATVIKDGKKVTLTEQEKKDFTIDGYQLGEIPPIPYIEVPNLKEHKFKETYSDEQKRVINAIKDSFDSSDGISVEPAIFSGGEMVYAPFLNDSNNLHFENTNGNDSTKIDQYDDGSKHYKDKDGNSSTKVDQYSDGSKEYENVDGTNRTKINKFSDGSEQYVNKDGNSSTKINKYSDGSKEYENVDGTDRTKINKFSDGSEQYIDESGTSVIKINKYSDGSQQYESNSGTDRVKINKYSDNSEQYLIEEGTSVIKINKYSDGTQQYEDSIGTKTTKINIYTKEKARYKSQQTTSTIKYEYFDKNNAEYEDDELKIKIADGIATIKNKDNDEEIEVKALPLAEVPMIGAFPDISEIPDIGDIGDFEVRGFRVIFDDAILFDFDKHELRPEGKEIIKLLVNQVNNLNITEIEVHGHTDSISDEAYNQTLSEKRASSVDAFAKEAGLSASTKSIGYGESKPVAPNSNLDGSDNPSGRQANRRVEVFIPVK